MITDTIDALIDEHRGQLADRIRLDWDVTLIAPPGDQPGTFQIVAVLIFAADSIIVGQRLWDVRMVPASIALDPIPLGHLLRDVVEGFNNERARLQAEVTN